MHGNILDVQKENECNKFVGLEKHVLISEILRKQTRRMLKIYLLKTTTVN